MNELGYNGRSAIAEELSYFPMKRGMALPCAHNMIHGIPDMFIGELLPLDNKKRTPIAVPQSEYKLIKIRGTGLTFAHDMTPYLCPIMQRFKFKLSSTVAFISRHAEIVLVPSLEKISTPNRNTADCWRKMVCAVLHYLASYSMEQMSADRRELARKQMWEVACFLQTHFPAHMLTHNLHMAVVHSYDQETALGSLFYATEFYGETFILTLVRITKHRVSRDPLKMVVNHLLLKERIDALDAMFNCSSTRSKSKIADLFFSGKENRSNTIISLVNSKVFSSHSIQYTALQRALEGVPDGVVLHSFSSNVASINGCRVHTRNKLSCSIAGNFSCFCQYTCSGIGYFGIVMDFVYNEVGGIIVRTDLVAHYETIHCPSLSPDSSLVILDFSRTWNPTWIPLPDLGFKYALQTPKESMQYHFLSHLNSLSDVRIAMPADKSYRILCGCGYDGEKSVE